jgi:hypothetical protein
MKNKQGDPYEELALLLKQKLSKCPNSAVLRSLCFRYAKQNDLKIDSCIFVINKSKKKASVLMKLKGDKVRKICLN